MNDVVVTSHDDLEAMVKRAVERAVSSVLQQSPWASSCTTQEVRPFYTVKSLSKLLGVDEKTVRTWEIEGHIPAVCRVGGRVLWPPEVIDTWIATGCARQLVETHGGAPSPGASCAESSSSHDPTGEQDREDSS